MPAARTRRVPIPLAIGALVFSALSRAGDEPPGVLVGSADPSIIAAPPGGKGYYVFATGAGLPFYHSLDLVHWRRAGRVFPRAVPAWAKEKIPKTRGIWAPHIERIRGRYYLYYSCSTFGKQRSVIGLAVNQTIDPADSRYRWEDRGKVISSHPGDSFNAIDPATFVDRDGSVYLFWGSFWSGIKAIELDPESGKPRAGASRVDVVDRRTPPNAVEAPFVIFRDGFYYLFVSFDSCCDGAKSTYRVMVGRSDAVLGPYVDARGRALLEGGATLVLASSARWRGPGHNSILREKSRDWLVHHTYDMEHLELHRILQIRPLWWGKDGWPVTGEPLVLTHGRPTPELTPQHMVGSWIHTVDYQENRSRHVEFLAGGHIRNGPEGSSWTLRGNRLTIRWSDSRAESGAFVDEVIVEPTGDSYTGRNQDYAVVRGRRVKPGMGT